MKIKNKMFYCILASICLGVFGGILFPKQMDAMSWIGELFINLLKLVVLPLIFSALVSAITSIGGFRKLGSIGLYTFIYVMFSVSVSVVIGLSLLNIFHPGVGIPPSLIL